MSQHLATVVSGTRTDSYREILASTLLIGGSSLLKVAIGIVRTKVIAVLLGPAGIGLMGVYNAIADLVCSIAAMGINSSGVRQIAQAAGTADATHIARTALVLRRTALALGLLGALPLMIWAAPISRLSFGSEAQAGGVALLGAVVLLRLLADGQGALLQGLRRIQDLARFGVLAALLATVASLATITMLGEQGIAPALVAVAASTTLVCWHYARKVELAPCTLDAAQFRHELSELLKLGVAFMASAVLMMGAAYVVRLIVLRNEGLGAAGHYQAAWTLGGLYVGFILQAMGTDFYPRLVAVIHDHTLANLIVNEQARISLLLAGPGVLATLTFASLVISVFYTAEFHGAIDTLRWFCLGVAMRVISWPMGYMIVANNRRVIFLGVELAWTLVNVGLSWWCVRQFGLAGAGIAFFASYVFHVAMIYAVVRRSHGFRWSLANTHTGVSYLVMIGLVFGGFQFLTNSAAITLGVVLTTVSAVYGLMTISTLLPNSRLPQLIRRLRGITS